MDSVAEQLRTRELAMIDSLQRYGYRVFTEIMTPVQVRCGFIPRTDARKIRSDVSYCRMAITCCFSRSGSGCERFTSRVGIG